VVFGVGWVLGANVGSTTTFFYGLGWEDNDPERVEVELKSGDMIWMNGQTLPHGVKKIAAEPELPSFWKDMQKEGLIEPHWVRLNLQFRDRGKIF